MEQIILNLVPGGVSPVCYVSQYDVGRKIRLHLRNGSDPYVLSGAETVTATIRKVSGEELIYDIANTSASYVDLIVNYDATDVIGESVCELIITESGTRLGSANFKMRIDPDVYSGDQKLEVVSATSENPNLSFETNVEENLLELKAGFSPVQDLHGYDSPWIDSNVVNKKPYLLRAIAGTASRIGTHEYNKIVGGTVAFNQMINGGNFTDASLWVKSNLTLTVSDNIGTATKTTQDGYLTKEIAVIANHKYFRSLEFKGVSGIWFTFNGQFPNTLANGGWQKHERIVEVATTGNNYLVIRNDETANFSAFYLKNIFYIDLTAMFGSTIADYIYSLEQATAGAGVAWFKALFSNDYYAYNAGELMSVKTSAHVTRDANNNVISNIALDPDLELRGIPKLDANNNLYYDGDEYASDGGVKRRYGVVDLGSRNWNYSSSSGCFISSGTLPADGSSTGIGGSNNVMCFKYVARPTRAWSDNYNDGQCGLSNVGSQIIIKDPSYSDPAVFKTAMSGVYFIYELAEPTTETADPFIDPQEIDPNGSEEFVDTRSVAIPVGHESYYANICEIEGWNEVNVQQTGVNLWDEETESGSINSLGQDTPSGTQIRTVGYVSVKPSTTYYLKTPKNVGLFYYDTSKTLISSALGTANTTFTTPSNCAFMRWYFIPDYGTTYNNDTSINYPSSDHDYHPYTGKLINLDWNTNQWDEEVENGAYSIYGNSGTGAKINASGYTRTKNFIPITPNTTYHIHRPHSGNALYIGFYDVNKNWLGYNNAGVIQGISDQDFNFTTSANARYMVFYDLGDITGTSINYPSTDHTYHPYKGHGVAYSGEVIYKDGGWKLRLLSKEVDLGDLTPVKYTVTEGNLFRYGLEDIKVVATNYDVTQALCSHYPPVAYVSRANNTMSQAATLHRIDIIDNRYSDATSFKAAVAGVKLVYPLETPIEIPLDQNSKLATVLGINNLIHDANGGTEVKFFRMISAS